MTQRTLAGLMAVPLLIALWLAAAAGAAALRHLRARPHRRRARRDPGPGDHPGARGTKAYRDDGQLRMTTVYVTQPDARVNLFELMRDWVSPDAVGLPLRRGLPQGRDHRRRTGSEGAVEMVSSQDAAVATALDELGYRREAGPRGARRRARARRPTARCEVARPVPRGRRRPGDVGRAGRRGPSPTPPAGQPVDVRRTPGRQARWTSRSPRGATTASRRSASSSGPATSSPFDVSVNIDESIGGPSAGLMFSLGIYDTLTKGSLTGGDTVAGTGTIDGRGPGRADRRHPAEDRRRPQRRCRAVPGAAGQLRRRARARPNGDMRLVKATTMHSAVHVDPDLGRGPRREAADL